MKIIGLNTVGFEIENINAKKTYLHNISQRLDRVMKKFKSEKYFPKWIETKKECLRETEDFIDFAFNENNNKTETNKKPEEFEINSSLLFHMTPIKDMTENIVYYEKIKSIAENGLLPYGAIEKDCEEIDDIYVATHKVLRDEKTFDDIIKRLSKNDRSDNNFSVLTFFIDTKNPIIKKLISWGRTFLETNKEKRQEKSLAETVEDGTIDEKMFEFFRIANEFIPDGGTNTCFLPIGIPASCIIAIRIPVSCKDDEKLLYEIKKYFPTAKIIFASDEKFSPNENI